MADAQGNQAKVAQLGDMGAAISFISNQLDLAGPGVGALLAGPEGILRQLCDAVNFRDPAPRCLEKGYLRSINECSPRRCAPTSCASSSARTQAPTLCVRLCHGNNDGPGVG